MKLSELSRVSPLAPPPRLHPGLTGRRGGGGGGRFTAPLDPQMN